MTVYGCRIETVAMLLCSELADAIFKETLQRCFVTELTNPVECSTNVVSRKRSATSEQMCYDIGFIMLRSHI